MSDFKHLKPGDEVFVVFRDGRRQSVQTETAVVVKVGRKYGYIEKYGGPCPFCLTTGYSHHGDARVEGYGFRVFLTEQDWTDQVHAEAEFKRLRERMVTRMGYLFPLSSEAVEAIHSILDSEQKETTK